MYKLFKLVVSFTLFFTLLGGGFTEASASTTLSSATTEVENTHTMEILKQTKNMEEYKFTHKETGETEYLKIQKNKSGITYTSISSENKITTVTQEGDILKIKSEEKEEILNLAIPEGQQSYLIDKEIGDPYQMRVVPNPGGGTWYLLSGATHYGSSSFDYAILSAVVALVLGIATRNLKGAAVVGSATTIASTLLGLKVKNVWYIKQTYWDRKPNSFVRAYFTKYYAYPDYTKYTGSLWAE